MESAVPSALISGKEVSPSALQSGKSYDTGFLPAIRKMFQYADPCDQTVCDRAPGHTPDFFGSFQGEPVLHADAVGDINEHVLSAIYFGVLVIETAEIAVIPIAETILESMTFVSVLNNVSRKDGIPIDSISLTFSFLMITFHLSLNNHRSMVNAAESRMHYYTKTAQHRPQC